MTTVVNLVRPTRRRTARGGDERARVIVPRCPLADPEGTPELRALLGRGFVIGSHTDYPGPLHEPGCECNAFGCASRRRSHGCYCPGSEL